MHYLVDTNVFLHSIDSNIYGVAIFCKNKGTDVCITETILNELDPGYYRENEDASTKEIYTSVKNFVEGKFGGKVIKLVKLTEIEGALDELKKIRERFYGWMTDTAYLQRLINQGILTQEDIKKSSFRKKDMGECELVAIAKASGGEYWLVTNDKGNVYKHPDINIFDTYAGDSDVIILTGKEWLKQIGYIEEN